MQLGGLQSLNRWQCIGPQVKPSVVWIKQCSGLFCSEYPMKCLASDKEKKIIPVSLQMKEVKRNNNCGTTPYTKRQEALLICSHLIFLFTQVQAFKRGNYNLTCVEVSVEEHTGCECGCDYNVTCEVNEVRPDSNYCTTNLFCNCNVTYKISL